MALSTVSLWLKRIGLGKRSRLEPPEPPNRYERRRPGELVHVDVKKLGRIRRRRPRVTGNRGSQRAHRVTASARAAGWEYVHVCVDDATRLAYVEVLADERGATAVGFLRRAVAWFAERGITVERVMTDNGSAYVSTVHAARLPRARAPPPPHPALPAPHQRQGRALHPDAAREWAYGAHLRQLSRAHRRAAALARALQLPPTTRLPRPQATGAQRAEQPGWELHLVGPPGVVDHEAPGAVRLTTEDIGVP